MPSPFNFSIYICVVCGLTLVIGSIALLATGVIKLADAGKDGKGFSVEIEKRIKIETGYPALALFILGFLFIGSAIWFSQPRETPPLKVTGKLAIDDGSKVTFWLEPVIAKTTLDAATDGTVNWTVGREVEKFHVVCNAAGYEPTPQTVDMDPSQIKDGHFVLPSDWKFVKTNKPDLTPGSIEAMP